jgi:predicted nucleic acid-binding protein
MIALDSNLLIYAHKQGSPFHAKAAETAETIEALRHQP